MCNGTLTNGTLLKEQGMIEFGTHLARNHSLCVEGVIGSPVVLRAVSRRPQLTNLSSPISRGPPFISAAHTTHSRGAHPPSPSLVTTTSLLVLTSPAALARLRVRFMLSALYSCTSPTHSLVHHHSLDNTTFLSLSLGIAGVLSYVAWIDANNDTTALVTGLSTVNL